MATLEVSCLDFGEQAGMWGLWHVVPGRLTLCTSVTEP